MIVLLTACAGDLEALSDWGLFEGDLVDQIPAEDVEGFQVAAPLWADNADKGRFVRVPGAIGPEWDFPEDSTLVKSFYLGERIVETRLLVAEAGDWTPYVYIWEDDQSEAFRADLGAELVIDGQDYLVPNVNQCGSCHEVDDVFRPLGPQTAQLDRDVHGHNQIDSWIDKGLLAEEPSDRGDVLVDPFGDAPLDERARSYLAGNCAHCHQPGGGASVTGLHLGAFHDDATALGICKVPAAAGAGAGGRQYDIVPGYPDDSVLVYRMESVDPEIKMPELPNQLADDAGVELIRAWIASMEPTGCDSE